MPSDSKKDLQDRLKPPVDCATSGQDWLPSGLFSVGPPPVGDECEVEVLEAGSVNEVFERLVDGDPLGLREMVWEALDELAVLVDPQRLYDRTVARCAVASQESLPSPSQPLRQWVGARMLDAFGDLNEEDWSEECQDLPIDPFDDRYKGLVFGSALTPNKARRLALLFNQLRANVRVPLYALLVKGLSMTSVAREHNLTKGDLHKLVVRHLGAFTVGPRSLAVDPFRGESC